MERKRSKGASYIYSSSAQLRGTFILGNFIHLPHYIQGEILFFLLHYIYLAAFMTNYFAGSDFTYKTYDQQMKYKYIFNYPTMYKVVN